MEGVDCLGRMERMLCQAERDGGSISGWWEGRNESSKAWEWGVASAAVGYGSGPRLLRQKAGPVL